MLSLKPRPKTSALPMSNARSRRRFSPWQLIGISVVLGILVLGGAVFAMQQLTSSHAAGYDRDYDYNHNHNHNRVVSTIGGLNKISQVGSTANIVNANGQNITVDANPYDVAAAPFSWGNLHAGDLVVNNFGANGQGTSLVKFTHPGKGHLFNISQNNIISGPGQITFDSKGDRLWVANSGNANDVVALGPDGKNLVTIKSPLFNHPWGIATNNSAWSDMDAWSNDYWDAYMHHNVRLAFFVSNLKDGKILRIDVVPQEDAAPKFKVTQIGQLNTTGTAFVPLLWEPQLTAGGRTWHNVLLAGDPARNAIVAFPNSTDSNYWNRYGGWRAGIVLFQGPPLHTPGGLTLNPINGDLLIVNLAKNDLVELNLAKHSVVGDKQIDPAAVDNQGNGAALFGVLAVKDRWGNLKVFFTDDNTNTLNALSVS